MYDEKSITVLKSSLLRETHRELVGKTVKSDVP